MGHKRESGTDVAKKTASTDDEVVVIKKYANRRLYNTATSSYVTLDHLCEMVKEGKEFVVHDAKTNEDITRSVLTQIIFEEEGKGQNLLPIKFLRQLIRFYGDSLQGFVPSYLELSMDSFAREQEKLRNRLASAFGGRERLGQFEDQIRQNLAMFDSAMRMFSPFVPRPRTERGAHEAGEGPAQAAGPEHERAHEAAAKPAPERPHEAGRDRELDDLKRQLAAMQAQLEALAKK
jgi:polyhydroxyalkanoate synthesis repressor PhaR